jgi:hypothetical protein
VQQSNVYTEMTATQRSLQVFRLLVSASQRSHRQKYSVSRTIKENISVCEIDISFPHIKRHKPYVKIYKKNCVQLQDTFELFLNF